MKKLIMLLPLMFNSCFEYEKVSKDLDYSEYQSSIDTNFNYLEDVKEWEGINNIYE
tara:strand:- start:1356 stop:1523 length:168 start_codon:yes stop_codon:yes gene_type:complete